MNTHRIQEDLEVVRTLKSSAFRRVKTLSSFKGQISHRNQLLVIRMNRMRRYEYRNINVKTSA